MAVKAVWTLQAFYNMPHLDIMGSRLPPASSRKLKIQWAVELPLCGFPISFIFIMIAHSGTTNGTLDQETFPGKISLFPHVHSMIYWSFSQQCTGSFLVVVFNSSPVEGRWKAPKHEWPLHRATPTITLQLDNRRPSGYLSNPWFQISRCLAVWAGQDLVFWAGFGIQAGRQSRSMAAYQLGRGGMSNNNNNSSIICK